MTDIRIIVPTAVRQSESEVNFPRIGAMQIGAPQLLSDRIDEIARTDFTVLGTFPNFMSGGKTLEEIAAEIKAINPAIILIVYTNINEVSEDAVWSEIQDKLDAEEGGGGNGDWWARDAAGDKTGSFPGTDTMNMTDDVTVDSGGQKLPQWYADWVDGEYRTPSPSLDGIYVDVYRHESLVVADWDENGVDESKVSSRDKYTAGQRAYVDAYLILYPDDIVGVNATSWLYDNNGNGESVPTNYEGSFNGGFMEHALGASFSVEGTDADGSINGFGTWLKLIGRYNQIMDESIAEKRPILEMRGIITDYDFMRYGLTSALMDDGYFAFDDDTAIYQSVPWFDEFDYNLGLAIDARQTVAFENGVYVREFDNGLAVVNPRQNGTQTITLPSPGSGFHWENLDAADFDNQDPTFNDGATVTQVTSLSESDGRIITRVAD